MARVKDPVCEMMIDSDSAATSTFQGETYYFCSMDCADAFNADPAGFVKALVADRGFDPERHEPPFTKKGGFVAPKFGAAGNGGLEYEPQPERHDRTP